MKKLIYLVLLFLTFLNAKAQHNPNVEDLNALFTAIQKTPSYKKLLKGNKAYQQLYDEVKLKIENADERTTFKQLALLVSAINDNHLGFYRTPDTTLKPVFISLPLNVDSLKKQLIPKDKSDLEGIYYASNHEFGLFASGDKSYQIVSLKNGVLMGELFQTFITVTICSYTQASQYLTI
ncbi:hypothetical protein [Pedobacter sp. SL55]|uniref:hypothetical protein n=1 Tax=Pedobacter sp. SL55 TaxID=2995161 RepID=UPI00226EE266|nr:hypothetical protein [Pedobacter sp. SL55]WAC42259.1 hypothetical protein OVA16_07865 [Pedobacter sp. SL55]